MRTGKLTTLCGLMLLLATVGCSRSESDPAEPVPQASDVIALLNGEPISRNEFTSYLSFIQGELNDDPSPTPTRELFRDFLTRKLLMQEAKKEGITASSDQVEAYLSEWMLPDQQVDPEIRNHIYEFLVTQRFLRNTVLSDLEVTLKELQNYYQKHLTDFVVQDQARVREILVDTREEAEALLRELESNSGASFQELARLHSKGITASTGGNLGVFSRGDLPEEFEKAIFALKPGEFSKPFQSGHGFHIFFLEEWVPSHNQKFYEVRRQIFDELTAEKERQAVEAFLVQRFRESSLVINDPSLQLDFEEKSSDEPNQ